MTADEENAYRAPQANILPNLSPPTAPHGAWRDGPYLVVHKSFRDYPDRCIVCNAPQAAKARVAVRWIRAPIVLIAVGLAISPPIALIVFAALPTATVWPRVCGAHRRSEAWSRRMTWILALLGILLVVASLFTVMMAGDADLTIEPVLIATMLFAIAVIVFWVTIAYGVLRPRLLSAFKIDRQFVWLDKVSQEYLQHFPELGAP